MLDFLVATMQVLSALFLAAGALLCAWSRLPGGRERPAADPPRDSPPPGTLPAVAAVLLAGVLIAATAWAARARVPSYEFSAEEVIPAAERQLARFLRDLSAAGAAPEGWTGEQLGRLESIFERTRAGVRQMGWWPPRDVSTLSLMVVPYRMPVATSTPSGKVVLSMGFLERYRPGDDELAFVLAHEMAHVLCGHERVQLSAVWRRNAPQQLRPQDVLNLLETEPMVGRQIAPLVLAHERAADMVGLHIAVLAGFDPQSALLFFDASARLESPALHEPVHDPAELRKAALRPLASMLGSPQAMKDLVSCGT